jgi:hypothetical protein
MVTVYSNLSPTDCNTVLQCTRDLTDYTVLAFEQGVSVVKMAAKSRLLIIALSSSLVRYLGERLQKY